MTASSTNKRALPEQGGRPKKVKRPSGAVAFLDIEAAESSDDEEYDIEEEEEGDVLNKEADLLEYIDLTESDSSSSSLAHGPSGVRGLKAVIARYEDRRPCTPSDPWGDDSQEEEVEEPLLPIQLQQAARLPSVQDPQLWAIPFFEGAGKETFFTLHYRWQEHPDWARSIILPPKCGSHILVEAPGPSSVLRLCKEVSTIPQPLHIKLVPLEERVGWLHIPEPPLFPSGPGERPETWVRIRPRRVLREIGDLQGLERYVGDLALVWDHNQNQTARLLLIPRLPVKQPGQQRPKQLQRLLHPPATFPRFSTSPDNNLTRGLLQYDAGIYWYPGKKLEMEAVDWWPDVYQFRDRRRCRDLYARPFVTFLEVPVAALVADNVCPTRKELHLFSEGLEVGMAELNLAYLSVKFVVDSYHTYLAAPLEQGHRVEVNSGNVDLRGNVTGTGYSTVDVYVEEYKASLTVESKRARRVFLLGDSVKVFSSNSLYHGRVGWVLGEMNGAVQVLDDESKEQFEAVAWELVPFEMEHRWFLAAVNVPQEEKRRRREELQIRGHDQYQELVNTKVVIGGQHQEKGLRGNIRAHLGRCIMRVELESGARMADVHVNFLFPTERGGRDPRDHHVGQTVVPRDAVYSWPQPAPQPQIHTRAATPIPAEQPDPDTIEYDGQVLPADWLLKDGLAEKRIWAYIRNSRPDAFSSDEPGFMKGRYEGSRALTLGLNVTGAVNVHVKKDTVAIPCRYLFPERPASMGQKAVVISGEHVGEVFSTRKPREDGWFPLVRPGSKGAAEFIIEPCHLARCDA
ncbi:hypothetical protein JOM56_007256 [Amanita muscaria]